MNPKFTQDAMTMLKETSRTFYIPIAKLPNQIKEAVASAYLCLRAIDQIEDHPTLENSIKAKLLRQVSMLLQVYNSENPDVKDITPTWVDDESIPEVSRRIGEWVIHCPEGIRPRIIDATVAMSDRMACWAELNWQISDEKDLNAYTFSVAGAVGILLSDLWAWYEGTKTDRSLALGFGRGLQAVNILRNQGQDSDRGVEFYPTGWKDEDMIDFARKNLQMGIRYVESLPKDSAALLFCQIPLNLALATLVVQESGREQLSREDVGQIVEASEQEVRGGFFENISNVLQNTLKIE